MNQDISKHIFRAYDIRGIYQDDISPELFYKIGLAAGTYIKKDSDGVPLVTSEILVLINQPKRVDNEPSNVPVRGVSNMSMTIRPEFKLLEGRMWQPGTSEIIAGTKVADNFVGCGLGEKVKFGMREWTVVGIFETGGGGFESELWGDVDQLMDAFGRPVFSSLTLIRRLYEE